METDTAKATETDIDITTEADISHADTDMATEAHINYRDRHHKHTHRLTETDIAIETDITDTATEMDITDIATETDTTDRDGHQPQRLTSQT